MGSGIYSSSTGLHALKEQAFFAEAMNNFDFDSSKYSPKAKKQIKNSLTTENRPSKLQKEMPDISED